MKRGGFAIKGKLSLSKEIEMSFIIQISIYSAFSHLEQKVGTDKQSSKGVSTKVKLSST